MEGQTGKTTLANLLARKLRDQGAQRIEVLDGPEIRQHLSGEAGSPGEGRRAEIRRIAFVCSLLSRNGVIALVAAVSPYREMREAARRMAPRFVEVFVDCPLEVCIRRDVEGVYRGASNGGTGAAIGGPDAYEPPRDPEVVCKTSEESPEASVDKIIAALQRLQYITAPLAAYSAEEEELIRERLEGLGYL